MTSIPAASRAVLLGALGIGIPGPALADADSCSPLAVDADNDVLGRWPELPERIREAFAGRDGIDSCVRVTISLSHPAITVEVTLADGRSARRSVAQREDVVPVLEALLLVPQQKAVSESSGPSTAANAKAEDTTVPRKAPPVPAKPPRRAKPVSSEPELSDRSPNVPEDRFGIELSVVTGARIGDGQPSVGLGALSFLDLWGWLVGFEGRVDGYTSASAGPHAMLELAALAGRRFRFESLALDVIAGPSVAVQEESTAESGPAETLTESTPTGDAMPRLLFATHLNFASRSMLRTFVGVEGAIGPGGPSDSNAMGGQPSLPAWMVGLALGATVGTR